MNGNPSRLERHPVDSRHLPPRALLKRNVETPYLCLEMDMPDLSSPHPVFLVGAAGIVPASAEPDLLSPPRRPESFRFPPSIVSGQPTARNAHRDAGQDAGRSQCRLVMSRIRDACARPEREPTSSRCFAARRDGEPPSRGKAMEGSGQRPLACAPSPPPSECGAGGDMLVSQRLLNSVLAGSGFRPLKCLSPVRGNSHAGFLEGCGGRKAPVPTRRTKPLRGGFLSLPPPVPYRSSF